MKNSFAYSIFKIGILLLIVYSFSGCKKTTQPLTYKFSANALAYIQFTSGKYFIYKDSAANKTDSVVVTESLIQPNSHIGTGVGFDFSYNDQKYIFTLTEINPGDTTVWLSGDGFSLIECVLYSGNQQFELYQENAPIIPAIVIEGKTYANVNLTSNGANAYYWAKGIGLIKRRETNGTVINTYTLLRNN